jgi:hypothetical protein
MRRAITTVVPLGTVILLILAVSAWATPSASKHGGGGHHGKGRTITVIEHATTDTTTDTGAAGDTVGDILTFANEVFDAADATKVGTDNGYCLRTVVGDGAAYECHWTTFLAGGQISVERRRPLLRREGQHARHHRRHRALPRRQGRDGARVARERGEVPLHVPPQPLSHATTSATNRSGPVSIAA